MSDPTAESGRAPAAQSVAAGADAAGAPRETGAGVVGVAFGLLLIAALVLGVVFQPSKPVDAQALIDASFEIDGLPFGLVPADGAQIASGERLVLLEVEGLDEAPRVEVEAPPSDDDEEEEYDWSTLVEGEPGTAPVQVFLVWYPQRGAGAAVERLFEGLSWKDLRDFNAAGGRLMTDKDTLPWAGYDADYVIERELERGGTFRDWMRVNLSLPDRVCVLFARWARGRPAAKERVVELLAVLRPREGGDDLEQG